MNEGNGNSPRYREARELLRNAPLVLVGPAGGDLFIVGWGGETLEEAIASFPESDAEGHVSVGGFEVMTAFVVYRPRERALRDVVRWIADIKAEDAGDEKGGA